MNKKRCNNVSSCSTFIIWRNYFIGICPIAVVPLVCYIIPWFWFGLATLLMSMALFVFFGKNRISQTETCAFIPYASARTLIIFTLLSLFLALISDYIDNKFIYNLYLGFSEVAVLVLAPLTTAIFLLMYHRKWETTLCADCLLRNGTPYERELIGHFYSNENGYLIPRIIKIFIGLSIIEWGYYLFIDTNKISLDKLDAFMYLFFPIVLFLMDCIVLRMRYYFVGLYYKKKNLHNEILENDNFKMVRIVLISNERVYYAFNPKEGKLETPFGYIEEYSNALSVDSVLRYMADVLGHFTIDHLRFCYGTQDSKNHRSIEHYLCFIENESQVAEYENESGIKGVWLQKKEIEKAVQQDKFSKIASSELHRIYTIMHTSKLYDLSGKRIVNVKGFKPSFSISELRTTQVDFSDNRWMILSKFNADTFRGLKEIWYKYIEGMN